MPGEMEITPRAAVLLDLREGLGVEDIALRRDMTPESVREIVGDLRRDGVLAKIDWLRRDEA